MNVSLPPKPVFDKSISYGAILQAVTVIISALGLFAYGIRFQTRTELRLDAIETARAVNAPIFDQMQKNDTSQDFRLESMARSAIEDREVRNDIARQINELAKTMNEIKLDVAVIKQQLAADEKAKGITPSTKQ